MVVPEEREGKTDDDPWLARDAAAPATATLSTRKGGYEKPVQQKVCAVIMVLLHAIFMPPPTLWPEALCFQSVHPCMSESRTNIVSKIS